VNTDRQKTNNPLSRDADSQSDRLDRNLNERCARLNF